jgi:uncharacterized membrane protein YfcA
MIELDLLSYGILFGAALMAGFVDSIAGGGGIITVPALLAVGIPPHVALATNKLQSSFGSFTASLNYTKKGLVDPKKMVLGIFYTFIGAVLGTTLILFLDASLLAQLIPFMLILVFIYTLFSKKVTDQDRHSLLSTPHFYLIFGILIGFYDGFFGPGTGAFWTIAFVAVAGYNLKKATAHTKIMNFTSNIVSLGVFIIGGHIFWIAGILMGFGQIFGAYLGSSLVVKKEVKFIRIFFLSVVAITIAKLLYDQYY